MLRATHTHILGDLGYVKKSTYKNYRFIVAGANATINLLAVDNAVRLCWREKTKIELWKAMNFSSFAEGRSTSFFSIYKQT